MCSGRPRQRGSRDVPYHTQKFLAVHCIERWGRDRQMSGPHDPLKEIQDRKKRERMVKAEHSKMTQAERYRRIERLHASQRDPLSTNFRLGLRELMNTEEIKELVKWRFEKELKGELPRMIVHEVFASARGRVSEEHVARVKHEPLPIYPSDNIFAGWTIDEKQDFYDNGTVPERYKP